MSARSPLVLLSLLLAGGPVGLAADPPPAELGHRQGRLAADGDAGDWPETATRFTIARPASGGEPVARATARLAWDQEALWVLFEVEDPTLHLAPPGIQGPELFQWDSVEIYLDGRGDRAPRMKADDFQVILAPDGRYAVLQGDPLLHEIEKLDVPKRERPAVALAVAGRRVEGGYRVEGALPFAALGIVPRPAVELALDLGLNDWIGDHEPVRQLEYDLESLRRLDRAPRDAPPGYSRNGLAADRAPGLEQRLYRPWSLAGSGDFGHPGLWRRVRLVGRPTFAERVVESLGPSRTIAGGGLAALFLVVAVVALDERRHRRRIAALLDRIAAIESAAFEGPAIESAPPVAPAASRSHDESGAGGSAEGAPKPAPRPPDPLEWLEHAADRGPPAAHDERLELRAMRTVRCRLDQALSPADLADALFVSLRTLQRHLAGELACSPGELILAVKMREARRLLEQGGEQVQEVARRVGYDDPGHFTRRFKVYFGTAPASLLANRSAVASARRPAA